MRGRFNIWLYRKSNGRVGAIVPGTAAPICLLTTTGRRSGLARTTPVVYLEDGERVILAASHSSTATHPDWYLNLSANPRVTVEIDGDARAMIARTASSEERAQLWPRLVELYNRFDSYQARATREIPVVICTPGV